MTHATAWLWLGMALTATAAGQLVFKRASSGGSRWLLFVAIATFGLAPPASYMALHGLTLATVYISTALSQLVVVLASIALFGERYGLRQWLALGLIVIGILVFNFGSSL